MNYELCFFAICLYFVCLDYLPSFVVFESAIIGFLKSTVLMKFSANLMVRLFVYDLTM